jgi:hypothetical protein
MATREVILTEISDLKNSFAFGEVTKSSGVYYASAQVGR